jgi:4-hydroxy-tetrahydrodipicolinate synthase
MNQNINFNPLPGGLWPVMITPFKENFEIDLNGLKQLTEFYLNAGAKGLFANCLSSEMFELSPHERIMLVKTVTKTVAGSVPVVATGTFGNNLDTATDFIKEVYDCGVDAVVININQLVKPGDPESLIKKTLEFIINKTSNIPLGTYECPVPYKRLFSADLLQWLAETGRFFYHKDTSCDIRELTYKINAVKNTNLGIYNAHTPTALLSLKRGGRGLSPIGANFFPELYDLLINNYNKNNVKEKISNLSAILNMLDPLLHKFYPASSKIFLKMRGLNINVHTRLKLPEMKHIDYQRINNIMNIFKNISEYLDCKINALGMFNNACYTGPEINSL